MNFKFWLMSILFIAINTIHAEEKPISSPLTNTVAEMGVSAIAGGCVNAITGDFVESAVDFELPGPEPIIFERSFSSFGSEKVLGLYNGWKSNHHSWIEITMQGRVPETEDEIFRAVYFEPSGRSAFFRGGKADSLNYAHFHLKDSGPGYTNCGGGIISAQNNPQNYLVTYFKDSDNVKLKTKSINKRKFSLTSPRVYSLFEEKKSNGLLYNYEYIKKIGLSQITLTNHDKTQDFGFIKIHLPKKPEDELKFNVESSDGRKITYELDHYRHRPLGQKHSNHRGYIKKVEADHLIPVSYEYRHQPDITLLTKKEYPKSRCLHIDYYRYEKESIGDTKVDIRYQLFNCDRVKQLRAPVGVDATPVVTHTFLYTIDPDPSDPKNLETKGRAGSTLVLDAQNHCTSYIYTKEHRLSSIQKHTGTFPTYSLYSSENILWGDDSTPQAGYLLGKYHKDGTGNVYQARLFDYDAKGNIIGDTTYGNISGHSAPIIWNGNAPVQNGCDKYSKRYKYNIHNLMIEEKEDNGKGVSYLYKPYTDVVEGKLITDHETIRMRHFFEYDSNAVMTKKIVDNGTTPDVNNLTDVTERRITYIYPRTTAPYGLPEHVDEMYLDMTTMTEVLLKRTVNTYSKEGYLLKQETYDSNEDFAYAQEWQYNAHGLITLEIDPLGNKREKKYDENNNLILENTFNHYPINTHEYDYANRLIKTIEQHADGTTLTKSYRYDTLGNRIAEVDAFGSETNYLYDEFSRLILTHLPALPTEQGDLIRTGICKQYDVMGFLTAVTDQCNHVTLFTHNIHGKPTSIRYPDGSHESFEYNLDGTLYKSVGKNGSVTIHTYDYLGRLLKKDIYSPKGDLLTSTSSTYNAFHVTSTTDAEGCVTTFEYDGAGRLKTTKKEKQITTYEYDSLSRIYKTKDAYSTGERIKIQTYDALNRVLEERIEDSVSKQILRYSAYSYDANGNVTRKTMSTQSGPASTITEYNSCNQPIKIIDPLGNTTHVSYNFKAKNAYGQSVLEITLTDPLGNQTISTMNAFNKLGQVVKKNPFGTIFAKQEIFYSGILDKQVTVDTVFVSGKQDRQVTTVWRHNGLHALYELVEALGTPEEKRTHIDYNAFGQKEKIIKPDGVQILHTYDNLGRLVTYQATDHSFEYSYTYNKNNLPICVTDNLNKTNTIREYDISGVMTQETLGNGMSLKYTYDPLNRPLSVSFPDGSGISYEYNAMNLTKVIRTDAKSSVRYDHHYTHYDQNGQSTRIRRAGNSGEETRDYDLLGRIKELNVKGWNEKLVYDAVGNLKNSIIDALGSITRNVYTYDELYQLQCESGFFLHNYTYDSLNNCVQRDGKAREINALNQLLKADGNEYAYDRNGNRISQKNAQTKTTYQYDALDRLVAVMCANIKYEYRYDAFNRRISKTIFTQNGSNWKEKKKENYIYQGQNEIGACDAAGKIVQLRILGFGRGAEIGSAVAFELGNTVVIPVYNHNGNVVALQDFSGNTLESYRYSAYGEEKILNKDNVPIMESAWNNPWRYSSKRVDEETGFIHFGRRHYDPFTGTWTSPDPIGFEGGPNLYAYVSNSPLFHIDLYGLATAQPKWDTDAYTIPLPSRFNDLSRFISRLPFVSYAGQLISGVGKHLLPIPIIGKIVRSFGGFFSGSGLTWLPAYRDPISDNYRSGMIPNPHEDEKRSIIAVNGIMTEFSQLKEFVNHMSKLFGNELINYTFNSTIGFIGDVVECGAQLLGFKTACVAKLAENIKQQCDRVGPDGNVYIYAHSQGGLITYRALQELSPGDRAKIHVVTFGTAAIIDSEKFGLASATNYISTRDPVPWIADPVGCTKAVMGKSKDVIFLNSDHILPTDHAWMGGNYEKVLGYHGHYYKHH